MRSAYRFLTGQSRRNSLLNLSRGPKGQPKGQGEKGRNRTPSINKVALPSATSSEAEGNSSDEESSDEEDSSEEGEDSSVDIEADEEPVPNRRKSAKASTSRASTAKAKGVLTNKKSTRTKLTNIELAAKKEFAQLKRDAKKEESAAKKVAAELKRAASALKKEEAAAKKEESAAKKAASAAKKAASAAKKAEVAAAKKAAKSKGSTGSSSKGSTGSSSQGSKGSTRSSARSSSQGSTKKNLPQASAKASEKVSIIEHYRTIFNYHTDDVIYQELMKGLTIFNASNEAKSNSNAKLTIIAQISIPKSNKEICEYIYDFIKNHKFNENKYYSESMITINDFSKININTEMNQLFQICNDTFNSAKKSVKLYGSDIQYRNDNTGAPITNMVKIIERKGWNGAQMIQRQIENSLGLQQEKAQINDDNTKAHIKKLQDKMTPIIKYLITELIKTNLNFNMYNTLFELFVKNYDKYSQEKGSIDTELKLKLIDSRYELLKIIERYKLIKQIVKGFTEISPVKYLEKTIEKINFKDKSTKVFEINSEEMVKLHKSELQNKSSAMNMKLVTSQIYNIKSVFNVINNLIQDYNKKENPTLTNYLYGSL